MSRRFMLTRCAEGVLYAFARVGYTNEILVKRVHQASETMFLGI